MMNAGWLEILNKVKSGEISVEEGARRLDLSAGLPAAGELPIPDQAEPAPYAVEQSERTETVEPLPENFQPDIGWWKDAWLIPFGVGTGILVLAAVLMGWAYSSSHFFWFYCSWLPMLLGILVLVLGWWSRQARWVHVRVQDKNGSRVAVSLPLPLRLAGWALRMFGPWIPKLKEQRLDDLPVIFDALSQADGPLVVEVDDEDGDKVRVYIL